jgi:hypothetical protein
VARFRFSLATLLALSAILAALLCAQVSDEEQQKRAQFLKARGAASSSPEESPSPSATPKKAKHKAKAKQETSSTTKPKPKPSETPEPSVAPTPKKSPSATRKPKSAKHKPTPEKEATPKKKKKTKESPKPEKTPTVKKTASPRPSETPTAHQTTAAPRAIAVPSPSAPPPPTSTIASGAPPEEAAQVTIEKSGYEKPGNFWSRLFGGGTHRSSGAGYRYLTRSVRVEIDRAPVGRARWQFIVVHNSGTRQGNAAVFDYYHRHVRRMRNGLAYHFVIGNGTSTGNGWIEVGDRWRRQINGGHVHSDYLNNIALGICLVGDFNRDQPTRAQLESCEELIRYLRQRCGKIGDHYPMVKPHREMNPPRWATDCPGDVFPYSWFRRFQE